MWLTKEHRTQCDCLIHDGSRELSYAVNQHHNVFLKFPDTVNWVIVKFSSPALFFSLNPEKDMKRMLIAIKVEMRS